MRLRRVVLLMFCALLVALPAGCGGGKPEDKTGDKTPSCPVQPALSAQESQALNLMLPEVSSHITQAIAYNESSLPRNPRLANFIQAKITMLQSPTLANDIVARQYYYVRSATSMDGRTIPVVTVYPQASMCADAAAAVQELVTGLPILERFMDLPYQQDTIRIWYGFVLGSSSGIEMEDKGTYQARGGGVAVYEAILDHELSHSYIGHEGLNQLLELYVYNMVRTNSADARSWTFTRNYVAFLPENQGVHALLDVYQLMGKNAMAAAYKNVYFLTPRYGETLSDACKQAFIDQAPAELKAQVAAKMDMVGY